MQTPQPSTPAPQQYNTAPVQQQQQQQQVPPLEPPPENPFRESNMTLDTSDLVDANGKVKFKKIFMTRKKASGRFFLGRNFVFNLKFYRKGYKSFRKYQYLKDL